MRRTQRASANWTQRVLIAFALLWMIYVLSELGARSSGGPAGPTGTLKVASRPTERQPPYHRAITVQERNTGKREHTRKLTEPPHDGDEAQVDSDHQDTVPHLARHPHTQPPVTTPLISLPKREKARTRSRQDSLKVALFTTLKPCSTKSIRLAQQHAIESWLALPLVPSPTVLIVGNDPCGEEIKTALIGGAQQAQYDIRLVDKDRLMGPHNTTLLGASVEELMTAVPSAQVFGLINADILVSPTAAFALLLAKEEFVEFFMVGRRDTVKIELKDREHFRIGSRRWESYKTFANGKVGHDRVDAEDYFLWTKDFFLPEMLPLPNFHIGRPAYDNWLVHNAIHTWRPVIDATALFKAYHQQHDYSHLKQGKQKGTYWKSAEQEENYRLGETHGGWQHGLIEMVPLGFRCTDAALRRVKDWRKDDRWLEWRTLVDDCPIAFKDEWKPLSGGQYGGFDFYTKKYSEFLPAASRKKSRKALDKSAYGR